MVDWLRTNRGWLLPTLIVTGLIFFLFAYSQRLQREKRQEIVEIKSVGKTSRPPAKHPVHSKTAMVALKVMSPAKGARIAKRKIPAPPPPVAVHAQKIAAIVPKAVSSSGKSILQKPKVAPEAAPKAAGQRPVLPPIGLSPAEIIRKLNGLTRTQREREEGRLLGHRVKWTVYLFTAKKLGEDAFTVNFDSSSTGFGVVIIADLDLWQYIDIVTARQGDPIRILGTITAIDTNGTGQVTLKADSVNPANGKK